MCWCVCMPVLVIVLIESYNLFVKCSTWKSYMYVSVAVGKIQGKSRFIVADVELKNSTVVEGEKLVSNKSSVKRQIGY